MTYYSLQFWIVLFTCIGISHILNPWLKRLFYRKASRTDLYLLSLTSLCLFYLCDRISFFIFIYEVILTYYLLNLGLSFTPAKRKWIAGINIGLIVINLMTFKYMNLIIHQIPWLDIPIHNRPLPAGISFYSFQLIAYIFDTIHNSPDEDIHPIIFMNFFSFFPQIIAGPIERGRNLIPQLKTFQYRIDGDRFISSFPVLTLGIFYKFVIADNIAFFVDRSQNQNPYLIWMSIFLYGYQIYFDFAGYSLLAVGIGRLFGIHLSFNFLAPYSSRNIKEFWRRWNITLMMWFRDFIYIPLGGSRTRSWMMPLLAVWILSGVWHGPSWNFIAWGMLHGGYFIIYRVFGRRMVLPYAIAAMITFVSVTFSWLFFYESNLSSTMLKLNALTHLHGYSAGSLMAAISSISPGDVLPLATMILIVLWVLRNEYIHRREDIPYIGLMDYRLSLVMIVLIPLFIPDEKSSFIYFSF